MFYHLLTNNNYILVNKLSVNGLHGFVTGSTMIKSAQKQL